MEVGTTLLYVILAIGAYMVGKMGFAIIDSMSKESDCDKMDESINEKDNQTGNLLIKTFEDIGCQYEIDENDGIVFKYQGEEFKTDASNDNPIIWIYDVAWGGINIDDPNADYLKQAINKSNGKKCSHELIYHR